MKGKGIQRMNAPQVKTTFTLAEAADLLSCHRETLRRAILSGDLQAAKLGRGYRISRWDLEAFWKAGGGGDLFGDEPQIAPGAVNNARLARGAKKKNKQMQLTLPGTQLVDNSKDDSGAD